MIVNVNMSRAVYEYFKNYDLSQVVNTLLEMYDFTNLPQVLGKRDVERKVNVSNETYISLYQTLGPRNKKVSLGRLLEFAYNMDVLALPRFNSMLITKEDNPTASLVEKAYKALLTARKYDDSKELKQITELVYDYKIYLKENS